jgi:hypothetical protein
MMTVRRRRSRFNLLKKRTLEIFARHRGWLDVPNYAVGVGYYPIRGAYSYLARLWRWGLLRRSRDARGRVVYRICAKGINRLAWLVRGFRIEGT